MKNRFVKYLLLAMLASAALAQQVDLRRNVKGVLPRANGGTGIATITADNTILVSNGTSFVVVSLPDCPDTGGQHLNYVRSSRTFPCGSSGAGGGVTSLAGTANQITVSAATGAVTLSIPTNPILPGTTFGAFNGNLTGNTTGTHTGAVVGNVTGNSSTASAFAATPAGCASNRYAISQTAAGDFTCDRVSLALGVLGNLPVTNLNGGSGASNTSFWRGDGIWAAIPAGGVVSFNSRTGAVVPLSGDYDFSLLSGRATVPQGGSDATSLTGILQGHGTSAFTANAASAMLTYLRRKANVTGTAYEFAALPMAQAADYSWSQQPGGALSVGSNTVTLTPGPLGVIGSVATERVYLSGGTGAAEAPALTGGTCDGTGQASCTVTFTAANTHSGAWTIATASGGWAEAYNALPVTGGEIWLPATITLRETVTIGDGSSSAPSTKNNITIHGYGGGSTDSESVPETAGTQIIWGGPVGGTHLTLAGPIAGVKIKGLFFECDGSTRAATGISSTHLYNSQVSDLTLNGCSSFAIKHYAHNNPSGMATGANNNIWEQIRVFPGGSASASGMQVGGTATGGNNLDVAQNTFKNLSISAGGSGTCLDLRFADASTFEHFTCGGSGGTPPATGLKVTQVSVGGQGFPASIVFIQSSIIATTVLDDTTWSATTPGGWFLAFNNDAAVLDPIGTNGWSSGYSTAGRHWGRWTTTPQIYQSVTASTAIASTASETAFSKTLTIPAYTTQVAGTRIRVTASGKFSTTGTPTLQLAIKYGTSGVTGNSFAVIPATTTANNASNFGWTIVGELVMRGAVDAATAFTNGACNGGLAGSAVSSGCTYPNTFTANTGNDQTITVTAQWGASSASNTTTMETLGVEILTAGKVN